MSYHKARPDVDRPDPTQPASTVMHNGRVARPHAEVDGKPILGGLQNATVEGVARTSDEEKQNVKEYHEKREAVKKSQSEYFDDKTGEPKPAVVDFEPDPAGDKQAAPSDGGEAPVAEVKKNVAAEKKTDNKVEKKPDANPTGLQPPKVEEKK